MADKFELRKETDLVARMVDDRLKKSRFVLVSVGTGGGKTYIAIHAVARIIKDAHLIIFAPLKKAQERDWDKSIDSYNAEMGTDLIYDVFNYEKLTRANHYKNIADLFHQYSVGKCTKKRHIVIILDEAHRVKDSATQTNKRVSQLANHVSCARTIGLTATPISNSYMDAIGYFVLAGFYTSKTQFIKRHIRFIDDYKRPIIKDENGIIRKDYFRDYQMLDTLLKYMIVNVDVSHLKPKQYGLTRRFYYDEQTMRAYEQIFHDFRNGLYANLQQATQAMREFIALHAEPKNQELSRILRNDFVTRPVLIFYSYNAELEALKTHLAQHHNDFDVIEINGRTKNTEQDLLEPDNPRTIFLIQYRSGSEGLDAKWSNLTVFYAPTNAYQAFKQALGRNVRAGQKTGDVYQFRFIVENTIDAATWATLQNKADFTDKLMEQYLNEPRVTDHQLQQTIKDINL